MDPSTMAGMALKASESEGGKTVARLWERVLGPSADVLGQALGAYTQRRVDNLATVVKKANTKSRGREGSVHPRVAHRLIEEGSYADDEMMAEYLSGVLASARTPDEADDRGVSLAALVTSMSSIQVRLHFLLHRTWVDRIAGIDEDLVSMGDQRGKLTLRGDVIELADALGIPRDDKLQARVTHAFAGLIRLGLIENAWTLGPREESDPLEWLGYYQCQPTPFGFDLYGWALGMPDVSTAQARTYALAEFDPSLPLPLQRVLYPNA
ncbi:hypothetical protein [Leifsonia sp. NPDC077715]|uniref:hypothetical protein n=1 Tax=Leifsonia sp. NPDC077715 TaxID=3155539 RepID=UPI0034235AE9